MNPKTAKPILFVLIALLSNSVYSQIFISYNEYEIKLTVRDTITHKPLDFVTATLLRIDRAGKEEVYNYALSDTSGVVKFSKLSNNKYKLRLEYLGYFTKEIPEITFETNSTNRVKDLGDILLREDITTLEAVTVLGRANPVVYLGNDTIQYNAAAFDIKATDMLVDFLKKLPGWDINKDGKITVNGEVLDKITVNNRVFFVDDPAYVSRILPANIVNNIKVFKESSEFTQATGIDDGVKKNTANVSVKSGMLKGMVGEVGAGAGAGTSAGTNEVFSTNAFLARFSDKDQFAFSASAGNVNTTQFDFEGVSSITIMYTEGMGGFGGGGVSTNWRLGSNANLSSKDNKLKTDLSYSFNGFNTLAETISHRENYLSGATLTNNDSTKNNTIRNNHNINANMRYDSKKTSLIIRPTASYSYGNFNNFKGSVSTNSDGTLVNESESRGDGTNSNKSAGLNLTYTRKFDKPLRALTLYGGFSFTESESDGFNYSNTKFYTLDKEVITDQKNTSLNTNLNINSRINYYEPLKKNFFLNVSYAIAVTSADVERLYLNKDVNGEYTVVDTDFSNNYNNLNITHTIGASVNKQKTDSTKTSYSFGLNVLPKSMTSTGDNIDNLKQNVVNFSPNARFEYQISRFRTITLSYNGNTTSPTLTQLQPIPDNTDPLNYRLGNPDLVPSFSNNFSVSINYSKAQSVPNNNATHRISLNGGFILNQIISKVWYEEGGVRYTMPVNENGNYRMNVSYSFYKSLFKNKLSIMNNFYPSFSNGISYVNNQRNETKTLTFNENININYRLDKINMGTSFNTGFENAWYSVNTMTKSASWNNTVRANVDWTLPLEIKISTNVSYRFYAGYNAGFNDPYFIWNANISAPLFNKSLFLSFIANDILNTNRNIRRTTTENYMLETRTNMIGQYFMINLTYKFISGKNQTGAYKERANRALNTVKMGGAGGIMFMQ